MNNILFKMGEKYFGKVGINFIYRKLDNNMFANLCIYILNNGTMSDHVTHALEWLVL